MNYDDFCSLVFRRTERQAGPDKVCKMTCVKKNNSTAKKGIVIQTEGESISPVIYMDDIYKSFLAGRDIDDIVDDVLNSAATAPGIPEAASFTDYSEMREHLCFKLINTERNTELLEDCPNIPFLDLSLVVMYYNNDASTGTTSSFVIQNKMLNIWGIDRDTLMLDTSANCCSLMPPKLVPLSEMLPEGLDYETHDEPAIYVLTNRDMIYGAACLTYPDMLEKISEKLGGSYIMLPSSIHEVLIRKGDETEKSSFDEIVEQVNSEVLCTCDILSNHSYYYDAAQNQLRF